MCRESIIVKIQLWLHFFCRITELEQFVNLWFPSQSMFDIDIREEENLRIFAKLLLFQIIQEYWQVLPDCYFARYVDMVTNWALLQSPTFSSSPPLKSYYQHLPLCIFGSIWSFWDKLASIGYMLESESLSLWVSNWNGLQRKNGGELSSAGALFMMSEGGSEECWETHFVLRVYNMET